MLVIPATADAASWHRRYYDNHFRSIFTCQSRGFGVIGKEWGAGDAIPGATSFVCYQQPGQRKYTMDILFSDWADGGGGGGSRSWGAHR